MSNATNNPTNNHFFNFLNTSLQPTINNNFRRYITNNAKFVKVKELMEDGLINAPSDFLTYQYYTPDLLLSVTPPDDGEYNLTNLKELDLYNNSLTKLPAEIGNLTNLHYLELGNNQLTNLPAEILKIKNSLRIDETSYEINNMDDETEIIVLTNLNEKITNLPMSLKELWLKKDIDESLIKIPFGCEIKYL